MKTNQLIFCGLLTLPTILTGCNFQIINKNKPIIVIDAGHQKKGNTELEPIGPNMTDRNM